MSDLLARRMDAGRSDVMPLPKLVIPSPLPSNLFSLEIITDGIEHQAQVKYSTKGREYAATCPGTRFYYTRGALPAVQLTATPRKGRFGQVELHLATDVESLMRVLLVSCHPLRFAVSNASIKVIQTNILPSANRRCIVYLSESQQVPLSSFRLDEEVSVHVYPSTCSYNREKGVFKCRLGAVSVNALDSLNFGERKFEPGHDPAFNIPPPELCAMVESFILKEKKTEEAEYDPTALTNAIFE